MPYVMSEYYVNHKIQGLVRDLAHQRREERNLRQDLRHTHVLDESTPTMQRELRIRVMKRRSVESHLAQWQARAAELRGARERLEAMEEDT